MKDELMSMLPIFVQLAGRNCLLVGAGAVALDKARSLLAAGAKLRVIAPEARAEIQQLALQGSLEWVERGFELSDLDGNFLVIAATNVPEVNAAVYRGCVERNIPCNSVDDIPNCDFFFGSVVSRGALQIAISTSGESPAVAQRLRHEIDAQLPTISAHGSKTSASCGATFSQPIPAVRRANCCFTNWPNGKSANQLPALRASWLAAQLTTSTAPLHLSARVRAIPIC